jgi:hypothetical protein
MLLQPAQRFDSLILSIMMVGETPTMGKSNKIYAFCIGYFFFLRSVSPVGALIIVKAVEDAAALVRQIYIF